MYNLKIDTYISIHSNIIKNAQFRTKRLLCGAIIAGFGLEVGLIILFYWVRQYLHLNKWNSFFQWQGIHICRNWTVKTLLILSSNAGDKLHWGDELHWLSSSCILPVNAHAEANILNSNYINRCIFYSSSTRLANDIHSN